MTFRPLPLFAHRQVQTLAVLLPILGRAPRAVVRTAVELALPGGGHLVAEALMQRQRAPCVVVLHGATGSSRDAPVQRAGYAAARRGYHALLVNLRGSGLGLGSAPAYYHAGLTEDVALALAHLEEDPLVSASALLGFSLGGQAGMLHATSPSLPSKLRAVAAVSPPLELAAISRALSGWAKHVYQPVMLKQAVRSARAVVEQDPARAPASLAELARMKTLHDFDEGWNARAWGFRDVNDYHESASMGRRLHDVKVPALLLHAKDDPLCVDAVVSPCLRDLPEHVQAVVTPRGGHIGFLSSPKDLVGESWALQQVFDFLAPHLR